MYQRVVIATDLSATTAPLLGAIPDLYRLGTREVTLVCVLEPGIFKRKDSERRADYERRLGQLADRLRGEGLEVHTEVAEGFSVQQILSVAKQRNAGLVLVGSRGYSMLHDVFVGSTLTGLLQNAELPVLVKHLAADGEGNETGEPGRLLRSVVMATDLSVAASAAEEAVLGLAPYAARVMLLSVMEQQGEDSGDAEALRQRLEALAEQCRKAGAAEVDVRLTEGHPASAVIRDVAHERDASLVIVGKHGYQGFRNNVMGRTTSKLARESERHVLMVPARKPGVR